MNNDSFMSLFVDFKWWFPLALILLVVVAGVWAIAEPTYKSYKDMK